jgi:hypothetical protein
MKAILALTLSAVALTACAATAAPQPVPADEPRVEAVYGLTAGKDGVKLRVSSNGCTKKADFSFRSTRSLPPTLTFVRQTPDRCQSFAQGSTWLTFSYEELGVGRSEFRLGNPVTAWTGPGE